MVFTSSFLDEDTYFQYFENKYRNEYFCRNFPLISHRMRYLCEKMRNKIHDNQKEDFFQLHAEILGLDAQLQILLLLSDNIVSNDYFSENDVILYAETDYHIFMKELCDSYFDDYLNHSLYFSII
jgi:hypothetical protein